MGVGGGGEAVFARTCRGGVQYLQQWWMDASVMRVQVLQAVNNTKVCSVAGFPSLWASGGGEPFNTARRTVHLQLESCLCTVYIM